MNEWVREGAEDGSVLGQLKPSGCSKAVFCFNYCLRKEVRKTQCQRGVAMEYLICCKEHRHTLHLQKPCVKIFHGYSLHCDLHVLYTKGMVMGF